MKTQILQEAEQDLMDGYRFYEMQKEGLGEYFLDSLFSDIDSLRLYAGLHPTHCGYYRILSRRFPYAVYYEVAGEVARVWAVVDCRREPGAIEERLKMERRSHDASDGQ